jgi:hypothetical protein
MLCRTILRVKVSFDTLNISVLILARNYCVRLSTWRPEEMETTC